VNKEKTMKRCFAVGLVLCLLINGSAAAVKGVIHRVGALFGPSNCVAVMRSPQGTCVITTDCEGLDISKTEFAFNCVGKNIVRHSFGVGGFDTDEEFDTELKCDQCNLPLPEDATVPIKPAAKPVALPAKPAHAPAATAARPDKKPVKLNAKVMHAAHTQEPKKSKGSVGVDLKPVKLNATVKHTSNVQKHEKSKGHPAKSAAKAKISLKIWGASSAVEKKKTRKRLRASPQAVSYGPNGCVSVYRSEESHCIMSTNCRNINVTNYEFGLVCVDKVGSPVKHLFGKDSFDPVETFDTLIKCNECLGLEDLPDGVALAGEVATLAKDISGLKAAMTNISINVGMLNKVVFQPAAAPAPAPALPTATFVPTRLLHKSAAHHRPAKKKKHLRHSHFRHHQYHVRRPAKPQDDESESDDMEGFD